MTRTSNQTACNGAVPPKQDHKFTHNPPTHDPIDKKSLESYHLQTYTKGPSSVPRASVTYSSDTQTHTKNLAAELEAILSRLG
ncbi:hypothetical protein F5B19DRAFT_478561 [Rostrohypoxylon terebratum]|nr:hypothetical protein F5B19DRAFT_478561 [Rostrohypoxylon terebratum]